MHQALKDLPERRKGIISLLAGLTLAGCTSSGSDVASVPNPYVVETGGVQVATMRTFGDSYSTPGSYGLPWSDYLASLGRVQAVEPYAVGGAQAAVGLRNSFNVQVDRFLASGSPVGPRDLTVAYFGYNDIGRGGSVDGLGIARAGYELGVNRLLNAGVTAAGQRLFLTQIHDWSRNPGVNPAVAPEVQSWNAFVAGVANRSSSMVAVDLYTALNRVYADPARFGFVNVTDASRSRASVDYLYSDDLHFGARGATIIARTFNHYLTRGWDWANSLSAGASASQRLASDIDSGVVFMRFKDSGANPLERRGLSLMPLGDAGDDRGLLLDYAAGADRGLRLGMALVSDSVERQRLADDGITRQRDLASDGMAAYMALEKGMLQSTTQFNLMSHSHTGRGQDDLIARQISRDVSSRTYAMRQRLQAFMPMGGFTIAPWGSIGHQQQAMDDASYETLYTSRSTVTTGGYGQWLAGLGVEAYTPAFDLGRLGLLNITGSVGMRERLGNPHVDFTFEETALPGVSQVERVALGDLNERRAGLGARLDLSDTTSMEMGYARVERNDADTEQFDINFSMAF
ncbi:hypothetical protein [Spiribacter pallidus]|uniref:Autotransporter domain-containing protein n=1 Tax=Spiribacter pallidus TaxID=1987936 RepID=A0ABV3TCQ6_9GAMM